jgi:hypothetical protein
MRLNTILPVALAAALGLSTLMTAYEARAAEGRNAALLGGFAAGALVGGAIGSAAAPRVYAPAPAPVYVAPPPPPPPPAYYASCGYEQRPVYDRWGYFAGYRPVRVCY